MNLEDLVGYNIGQYELLKLIGRGTSSQVYQARQHSIDREVALKVVNLDRDSDHEFLVRMKREAQTIASLSHPHIIKVFEAGQDKQYFFIAMELLKGGSLAKLLKEKVLPLEEVSGLFGQIASALSYAHRRDILHRDLKPGNILLDEEGNGFLGDFGLAKPMNEAIMTRLTQTGVVLGTPLYMSPEQWGTDMIDARCDIYSLAVMLFEMLTGKVPYDSNDLHQLMHMHIYEPPPSILSLNPALPVGLEPIIDRALYKDPSLRYDTVDDFLAAYKRAVSARVQIRVARRLEPAPNRERFEARDYPKNQLLDVNQDSTLIFKDDLDDKQKTSPLKKMIQLLIYVFTVIITVIIFVGTVFVLQIFTSGIDSRGVAITVFTAGLLALIFTLSWRLLKRIR